MEGEGPCRLISLHQVVKESNKVCGSELLPEVGLEYGLHIRNKARVSEPELSGRKSMSIFR